LDENDAEPVAQALHLLNEAAARSSQSASLRSCVIALGILNVDPRCDHPQ
jgi:hypothetical protein